MRFWIKSKTKCQFTNAWWRAFILVLPHRLSRGVVYQIALWSRPVARRRLFRR
ncbi:hypothetical protein B0F90DRAFT_1705322 [Multifurca ochricompacta]|uniref:Uncharacterized protein n=1 Tax=Multifurca ochricompacta TaxID=376703 RepID=A0AAD4M7L0_9AGAM|nr:hypothetical protein B0F90DRAFT_1705322 [Multifurca ochricompacta]